MLPHDHKRLGREMRIFDFNDQIGRGLPLWLPNGAVIREELERYLKELEFKAGYLRVSSPHLARESLYERSGHLPYFAEDMYPAIKIDEGEVYRLRPMNCPHHHLIFSSEPRSFRDLPLRLAELGQVYRNEASGALSGLMRVRGLCQNDAHIYCRRDQAKEELRSVLEMHFEVYRKLGLEDYRLRLSLGDPARQSAKFVDRPEEWTWSENLLRELLIEHGAPFDEAPGEAAFYGPKVDIQLRSAAGKEESFSSVQLDFASAERMDLSYVGSGGERQRPVILHRAPLGSHERIVAFLLERYRGRFPSWLAPVQARVLPVSRHQVEEARALVAKLRARFIRAELASPEESLELRLRRAFSENIPHVMILGRREVEKKSVMLRGREKQSEREISQDDALSHLELLIRDRVNDARDSLVAPLGGAAPGE